MQLNLSLEVKLIELPQGKQVVFRVGVLCNSLIKFFSPCFSIHSFSISKMGGNIENYDPSGVQPVALSQARELAHSADLGMFICCFLFF